MHSRCQCWDSSAPPPTHRGAGLYPPGRKLEESSLGNLLSPEKGPKDVRTSEGAVAQGLAQLDLPTDKATADELHSHLLSFLVFTFKYTKAPEITRHLKNVSNLKPRDQNHWGETCNLEEIEIV